MADCDIYVQPSRFEGYCTTINEARILGCPIVATDVFGVDEQLSNLKTGMIVPVGEEGVYQGVRKLLDEPGVCESFRKNLSVLRVDTVSELNKLYALMQ